MADSTGNHDGNHGGSGRYGAAASSALIVSPHFDDAVFSCGSLLLSQHGPGRVITVCGGLPAADVPASDWDERCGFASARDAAATRRLEDLAACSVIGAEPVHLAYLDAPHAPVKDPDEIAESLVPFIEPGTAVWAPAAIGGHPDHIATRKAALTAATRQHAVIRLYADTPYASARGWDTPDHDREPRFRWSPQLAVLAELGYELSTAQRHRLTAEAAARKIGLSRSYASQLSAMGHHYPLLNHIAGDLATEVWWDCRPVGAAQLQT